MKDMISYKEYYGSVHYNDEDQVFHGKIEFVRRGICVLSPADLDANQPRSHSRHHLFDLYINHLSTLALDLFGHLDVKVSQFRIKLGQKNDDALPRKKGINVRMFDYVFAELVAQLVVQIIYDTANS